MFASAAVLLILLAIMCIVNRHHPRDMTYWFGCIIVASSVIFLVPATYLDKINYFDSFFMRTEHIYLMITGLFQTMLDDIIETQTILLIIGVALILLTIVIHSIYLKYREARHRHNELTD
jgi:beta-lactamase regulating signal transducer with metallopeptidase domain